MAARPAGQFPTFRFWPYTNLDRASPAGNLINGPAAWVPISLSLCLVGFAFIWDVRLQLGPVSRA